MIRLTTEKLKQYDTNRVVEIAPKHNNELETVRFTMAEAIEPLTVPFTKKGDVYEAEIPNIFLKSFGNLACEIITTDKNGSFHVERQAFTVRKSEKPDDYKYEENVPVAIGGGGASSWNAITDKPFGEEVVEPFRITWDGNTDGLVEVVTYQSSNRIEGYYKVSDIVLTDNQIKNSQVGIIRFGGEYESDGTLEPMFGDIETEWEQLVNSGCVTEDSVESFRCFFIRKDNTQVGEFLFPEAGVYFTKEVGDETFFINAFVVPEGVVVVNKIPEKYIPTKFAQLCVWDNVLMNMDTFESVTMADIQKIFNGQTVYIWTASNNLAIPLSVIFEGEWAAVEYIENGEIKRAYTAEYTPSSGGPV